MAEVRKLREINQSEVTHVKQTHGCNNGSREEYFYHHKVVPEKGADNFT